MANIGTFTEIGGANLIEALEGTGLEHIIIDTEHGYFSEESVATAIRACENIGVLPYVRIGDTKRPYVLRMLDIGARALIVPHIKTIDQVIELVKYGKFPPVGDRGYCPTRTTAWGTKNLKDPVSYMQECNRRAMIIPQCETKEALEIIDEIAALDGVDGIFVGPCDLSIALGIPLEFTNPILIEAIRRILKACKANRKKSIIFAGNMENALFWKNEGFDSITYSLDATVINQSYRNIVSEFSR